VWHPGDRIFRLFLYGLSIALKMRSELPIKNLGSRMKKFLTGSIAAIVMAAAVPALAADMAPRYSKAPMAPPVVVYNWTGCYIGGNVGGGWARTTQSRVGFIDGTVINPPQDFGSSDGRGDFIGGGQIGCDYQVGGNWVVGVQGMVDFGDVRSSHAVTAFPTFSSAIRLQDTITATGRIGYLFAPQVLAYVKGGAAWARVDYNFFQPSGALSESATGVDRTGWTVGGGLEWMFAPGWSVFGEYNYMDFGRRNISFTSAVPPALNTGSPGDIIRTRLEVQQALVGVNYKFNWGGPVVAKY
jgi:outer membrane immunogenic protein